MRSKIDITALPLMPMFTIEEHKEQAGRWRAVRVMAGIVAPLADPWGQWMERRWAAREASNALYRELVLGLQERTEGADRTTPGLSPISRSRSDDSHPRSNLPEAY